MLYQVVKKAFDGQFIARIEDIAAERPTMTGATVEEDGSSTRDGHLRWIDYTVRPASGSPCNTWSPPWARPA